MTALAPPTYLRVVATTRCNLACSYCHGEGDVSHAGELDLPTLVDCLRVAARCGVGKFKFLGGDPLVRADLPQVIGELRVAAPDADISVITAGSQKVERLHAAFDAGLDRMNLSMHGFTPAAFAQRQSGRNAPKLYAMREQFVERLLAQGKPCKINYVYTGQNDMEDLDALLDWAAGKPVLVNVLDDLKNPDLDPAALLDVLRQLRGAPDSDAIDTDPHSLETLHLQWTDGLRVEIKHKHLGEMKAYAACGNCPKLARCREGIYALRLMHNGNLQLCMDRPDIYLPLASIVRRGGVAAGAREWNAFFMQEMNNEKNHYRHYRPARRGEDHAGTGDCRVVRLHFPRRNRSAIQDGGFAAA